MNGTEVPSQRQRRILWITLTCAALALLITAVAAREKGAPIRWTTWALPVVLMVNPLILMLRVPQRSPRIGKLLLFTSLAVTVAIIVAQIMEISRRVG